MKEQRYECIMKRVKIVFILTLFILFGHLLSTLGNSNGIPYYKDLTTDKDHNLSTLDIELKENEAVSDTIDLSNNKKIPTNEEPSLTFIKHGAITIDGNEDFTAQATANDWAGEGSESNPYIIENYHISLNSHHPISISNTDVFFIIRDNILEGAKSWLTYGYYLSSIHLSFVKNGIISKNLINDSTDGIQIVLSENILISENEVKNSDIEGISIKYSSNISIEGNKIETNYNGISSMHSSDIHITNNLIKNNRKDGITLINSESSVVSDNKIVSNSIYGISLQTSLNITIVKNTFNYNQNYAVSISANSNTSL